MNDFKKYLSIEDLKSIELELLNDLDSFCNNNDIKYYLAYGTLIGAVRHKGFIPWDDDIDVVMPRNDYDKFIMLYNQAKKPKTKVLHHSIDNNYYLPFAKLVDTRTVLKEDIDVDYEMGVYLDIFPLDNLSDDYGEAKRRMKKGYNYDLKLGIKTLKLRKGRAIIKNGILLAGKLLLWKKTIPQLLDELEDYCRETKDKSFTNYIGVIAGLSAADEPLVFEKEWFESDAPVEFEGCKYPAPVGTDPFLKAVYGDYMQLPPKEEQVAHHKFEAWYVE